MKDYNRKDKIGIEEETGSRKALSAVAEFLLVAGILAVAVMFVLIVADLVSFQTGQVHRESQQAVSEGLQSQIQNMRTFNGTTRSVYSPPVSVYNLSITRNSEIKARIPGQDFSSTSRVTGLRLENTCIANADKIAIEKEGKLVRVKKVGDRGKQWEPENQRCRTEEALERAVPQNETEENQTEPDRPTYNIVYVPTKYESQDFGSFKQKAQQIHSDFLSLSPFNSCTAPERHVNITLVSPGETEACNIERCSASRLGGKCFLKVEKCANSVVGVGEYDQAVGICDNADEDGDGIGDCEEDSNEIGLCGRGAGTPATSSVVLSPNSCPSNSKVGLHMMGHSLGLYGIDPGNPTGENRGKQLPGQCQLHGNSCKGPNSDDCEPQDEAASYIMSFCNQDRRYGPSATAHLRDVLDRYLWGGCR